MRLAVPDPGELGTLRDTGRDVRRAQDLGLHAEEAANLLRDHPLIEPTPRHHEDRLEAATIVARRGPVVCRQRRDLGMRRGDAIGRRGHRPDEGLEALVGGGDSQQEAQDSFVDPQRTPERSVPGTDLDEPPGAQGPVAADRAPMGVGQGRQCQPERRPGGPRAQSAAQASAKRRVQFRRRKAPGYPVRTASGRRGIRAAPGLSSRPSPPGRTPPHPPPPPSAERPADCRRFARSRRRPDPTTRSGRADSIPPNSVSWPVHLHLGKELTIGRTARVGIQRETALRPVDLHS